MIFGKGSYRTQAHLQYIFYNGSVLSYPFLLFCLRSPESPSSSIYTRYEGEDGVLNTLFCLANHFYPPTLNFTWTKNNVEVTEGVSDLRYRHNSDGTFHKISTLSFTPREGDVYSCTVEHQASPQPLTKSWGKTSSISTLYNIGAWQPHGRVEVEVEVWKSLKK